MLDRDPRGSSVWEGASIADQGNRIKVPRIIWITLPIGWRNQEEILTE